MAEHSTKEFIIYIFSIRKSAFNISFLSELISIKSALNQTDENIIYITKNRVDNMIGKSIASHLFIVQY